jgi:cytochrome c biogenesis protein CcmG/thiol:disulfide interchange protein DsbE
MCFATVFYVPIVVKKIIAKNLNQSFMKKAIILISILLLGITTRAQEGILERTIPSVDIKTMTGEIFNTSGIDNAGKPMVISFFALWCKPCLRELTAIADVYQDWQKETGVKLVAISIDDARSMANVMPTVNGNGWEYEFYCDPNGDFKRAMGVNMIPHIFVVNGEKQVVYQHTSFAEGGENELYEVIKKVAAGEK